jgi:hypothetical protein
MIEEGLQFVILPADAAWQVGHGATVVWNDLAHDRLPVRVIHLEQSESSSVQERHGLQNAHAAPNGAWSD